MKEQTTVLGIDPGTAVTGYAVIEKSKNIIQAIDYGCIRPPATMHLHDRYLVLYEGIKELLLLHKPCAVSVETQYVHKNPQSAIKLGMARGVMILAARKQGIPVAEYTPTKAKIAVVGTGRASKHQVQMMMQRLLKLQHPPTPQDAADALALAFCHINTALLQK